jgi:Reverse transcriptase (RNA-dependent DNA polymerase)
MLLNSITDCHENIDDNNHTCQTVDDLDLWFKSVQGLSILHLNIRSINKHWDELKVVLQNLVGRFDILVLSEISVNNVDDYYNFEGYKSYSKTRQNQAGGGILLFVKDDVVFEKLESNHNSFESISGILTTNKDVKISLLVIYRPPSKSKKSFVEELDETICGIKNQNVILIGDTNLNLLDAGDKVVNDYEGLMAAYGFFKCINDVTREERRADKVVRSCLDHIFVRSRLKEIQIRSAVYTTKISDHFLVAGDIVFDNLVKDTETVLEYVNCIDEEKLSQKLQSIDWSKLIHCEKPDELYDNIEQLFGECYDLCSYRRYISKKNKPKKEWMTNDLIKLMLKRDKLYRKWTNCKNTYRNELYEEYRVTRQQVIAEINRAKVRHYKYKLNKSKNSVKETWQAINEIIGKKRKATVDEVIKKHLGRTTSSINISNNFVNSFVDEVANIQHNCDVITIPNLENTRLSANQSLLIPPISSDLIKKLIYSLDVKKQPGIDRIRVKDLQLVAESISPVIAKLVNLCIKHSTMPSKLKISIIRPVYKKGDHLKYSNYRPIAILSIIEKIIERCIALQLTEYLVNFNIINPSQFGFQQGKSTSDLLCSFSDYVNTRLNNNMHVIALFIDFSKAFDTLNHSKLLTALEKIGIRGPLHGWFKHYLENRHIVTRVNDIYSSSRIVSTGVPQGSILGPILYLLYVNDITNHVQNCHSYLYADDTVLIASHLDIRVAERNLQDSFTNVLKFTHDKNLVINAAKTKLVHICSPSNRNKYANINILCHKYTCLHSMKDISECEGCTSVIEEVPNHVYLGVTIDNRFSWRPHIDLLHNKLKSCAFKLYILKSILPFNLLRTVYAALVESTISYGILAWGSASDTHLHRITSLQNKIIKNISSTHFEHTPNEALGNMYRYCNFLPVNKLFEFKFILNHYFENIYKAPLDHNINTRLRLQEKFKLPSFNNKFGKRRLEYRVPATFNNIPSDLRHLEKYLFVKTEMKNWLINTIN